MTHDTTDPKTLLESVIESVERLRRERDASLNALHGMRRRVARLSDEVTHLRHELAVTRDLLESTDDWQQGMLEDHWDHLADEARERAREEE